MSTYITSVGGRTVLISRIGSPGPPCTCDNEQEEFKLITTQSGISIIDTLSTIDIRSATYIIQLASSSGYQLVELDLIHDDENVYLTQSDVLYNDVLFVNFSAEIIDNLVYLKCECSDEELYINFKKTTLSNSGSYYIPFPGDLNIKTENYDLEYDTRNPVDLMLL